jgi:Putative homoserine kinase type II (protein kinase fold)
MVSLIFYYRENFLNGYQKERKLSNTEIEKLPILCSGSALRFLLTRLVDWRVNNENAMVTPKNPNEFIKILDFHKDINNPEEYGI